MSITLLFNQPAQVVAVDGDSCRTQADLVYAVNRLADQLSHHSAHRWILVHENSWSFAIGLLALLAAGKPVVLPANAQPGALAALRDSADALLGEVANSMLPTLAIPSSEPAETMAGSGNMPILPAAASITLYTSGSTGEAKAIAKSWSDLLTEVAMLEQLWGSQLGDATVLATVSHHHLYGLLFRLLWPLLSGRPFVTETVGYPELLMAKILSHNPCFLVASPAQLKRFAPDPCHPVPIAVFSSGGPLPFDAAEAWQQVCAHWPIEVLGSTETGGVAWRQQQVPDESWTPFPGVDLASDTDQCLLVKSPWTGSIDPVPMGDRALIAADGRFQILGRIDRIVKIEEKRLSLTGLEQLLLETPWVHEARALVLANGRPGIVAVLTETGRNCLTSEGKPALVARLREQLGSTIERVLLPRHWRFPPALPVNTLGKTTTQALRALFEDPHGIHITEIAATPASLSLGIEFCPDAAAFEGHFPDLPILPGVVQFDLAIRQCTRWYPLASFHQIDRLKFQEPVVPGDRVTLVLDHHGKGEMRFTYRLGGRLLSSGRIRFQTDNTTC